MSQKPRQNMKQNKLVTFGILVFLGLILVTALSNSIFKTIGPGEKGVIFRRFGGGIDRDHVYDQGFHIIAPWNTMYKYDVRTNENFEKMEVLSKNGLKINCELSYRYQPMPDKVAILHDEIGDDYHRKIIVPEIRSATREVIGKYLPEELYSSKREAIQDEIFQRSKAEIEKKNITLDAILIRDIALPQTLQAAIERKLKEEQESLQYEFLLAKERKEAERKIIEAKAKAESNRILTASLSDKILRDKGIDATLELATSPNTKVIVVGGGGDGLPLILGN